MGRENLKHKHKTVFHVFITQYSIIPTFHLFPSFCQECAGQRSGTTRLGDCIWNVFRPLTTSRKKDAFYLGHDGIEARSLRIKLVRGFLQLEKVF